MKNLLCIDEETLDAMINALEVDHNRMGQFRAPMGELNPNEVSGALQKLRELKAKMKPLGDWDRSWSELTEGSATFKNHSTSSTASIHISDGSELYLDWDDVSDLVKLFNKLQQPTL